LGDGETSAIFIYSILARSVFFCLLDFFTQKKKLGINRFESPLTSKGGTKITKSNFNFPRNLRPEKEFNSLGKV
jgi:hypothetical protein